MGDAGLFIVFAAVVTACLFYMFLMMPETKGVSMEEIENIFLSPRNEGCKICRTVPNEVILSTLGTMSKVVDRVMTAVNDKGKVKT